MCQPLQRDARLLVELLILLDLTIPTRGQVVLVGLDLILGDPKLAGELVDLRLQRRYPRLKFSEFSLGFLAGRNGFIGCFA